MSIYFLEFSRFNFKELVSNFSPLNFVIGDEANKTYDFINKSYFLFLFEGFDKNNYDLMVSIFYI
jgi:hypothetical protein